MRESWVHNNEEAAELFQFLKISPARLREESGERNGETALPLNIIKQLSEWSLLNDVPFQYYVAREDMLPPESIRFFYLDHNWLLNMLDGACSIGRTVKINYLHDQEVIEQIYKEALRQNENIRRIKQRKAVTVSEHEEELPACTGFLLRSVLVKDWRGMEFKAYDAGDNITAANELKAIRIETLGENVLLGLYKGTVRRIEIAQPPEGLHYGFALKKEKENTEIQEYEKALRSLETGEILYKTAAGTREAVTAPVAVKKRRVIDWKQTVHNIAEGLFGEPGPANAAPGEDAALIALQMIQNAYTGVIKNDQQDIP